MKDISLSLLIFLYLFNQCRGKGIFVDIDHYYPVASIDEKFVGVTIDTSIVREHWKRFDFNSTKLQNLAKGLSPSWIRFGGTDADFCIFSNNETKYHHVNRRDVGLSKKKHWSNFTLTETDWDNLHNFIQTVGWDLIFDLNALQRNGKVWDPQNAISLIEYTKKKNYKVAGWELGNEPNAFHHLNATLPNVTATDLAYDYGTLAEILFTHQPEPGEYVTMGLGYNVTASQLAQDYLNLSTVVKKQPKSVQGNILIGPSTIPLVQTRVIKYFAKFFESGGGKAVTSPNFHHYYLNGKFAKLGDFLSPNVLNSLEEQLKTANEIARRYTPGKKVWMGETSSAWGGGAANISCSYAAAFLWLDKLGLAARHNFGGVLRQAFIQGNYALVDPNTCDPNPDYWLTVLYKRLVGSVVFPVFVEDYTNEIRLYSHCANTKWYTAGSLVLYGMNLYNETKMFYLPRYKDITLDLYLLQAPDSNLYSRTVLLNGIQLHLKSDYSLPNLHIPKQIKGPITLTPYSYFFLVIPGVNIKECLK